MQIEDLKPGLIGVGTSFGASICCVLPMTIVLLGLGSGGFMMVTMQYRIILYPLGLLGLVTAYWLYFRRRKVCDAQACRMQGKRWNIGGTCFFNCSYESGDLCGFFSCFTVKEDNAKNRISFLELFCCCCRLQFCLKRNLDHLNRWL